VGKSTITDIDPTVTGCSPDLDGPTKEVLPYLLLLNALFSLRMTKDEGIEGNKDTLWTVVTFF